MNTNIINKSNNKNNTLIIIDWDDTLFPTSWTMSKKYKISDPEHYNFYVNLLSDLDIILFTFFKKILNLGKIMIITNALVQWFHLSCNLLPKTYKLINKTVDIVSARSDYQHIHPNNLYLWKELAFKKTANLEYRAKNIISIGDADYEYKALINLYDANSAKYLKSIKFMGSPELNNVITQIHILNDNISNICYVEKHLDKVFKLV